MDTIFKAVADPTRRRILELLKDGPLCAGDIAAHFSISKPSVSTHLATLKAAGLIDVERKGSQLFYELRLSVLEEAMLVFLNVFSIKPNQENKE